MRYVSVMQLHTGCEAEYKKRHDELWPELSVQLKAFDIHNYFIHLHPDTLQLFASFEASENFDSIALAEQAIMKKWWDYMADIMDTEVGSNAPVAIPLSQVFEFNVLPSSDDVCLVLDIGKTNIKLCAIRNIDGETTSIERTPNKTRTDGLYPSVDTDYIWKWLKQTISTMAKNFNISGIAITTHGATIACMNDEGLALPILDYESNCVFSIAEAYSKIRPDFNETLSPNLPVGLNIGRQVFWLQSEYPEQFNQTTSLLTYPQYWGFRLSGVLASEVTSLGCHTDLWNPSIGEFSSLIDAQGWQRLFPELMGAGEMLGNIKPDLARELGLSTRCKIYNGIHDSNASLVPHLLAAEEKQAIISSGTWTIIAGIGSPVNGLVETKDMLANVDAFGAATPSIRFMGGREWEEIKGSDAATLADVMSVMKKRVFALPTFADGVGPFPNGKGHYQGDVETLTEAEKSALATLYLLMMIDYCLLQLEQDQTVVVEGAFAKHTVLVLLLASLRVDQLVRVSRDETGTSAGTAMLTCRNNLHHWSSQLDTVAGDVTLNQSLSDYRGEWMVLLSAS